MQASRKVLAKFLVTSGLTSIYLAVKYSKFVTAITRTLGVEIIAARPDYFPALLDTALNA